MTMTGRHGRIAALAVCAMVLAACTVQPVRKAPPVAVDQARQTQLDREAALDRDSRWSLQGRVALSNGRDGGSGRIEWQQVGPRYAVTLSAPITRQSWRLSGGAGEVLLEGLDGGPRHGSDPAQLLRASTGWDIPVLALTAWLRGARAQGLGPAQLQFGVDGHLLRIEQGGWVIEYRDWRLPPVAQGDVAVSEADDEAGEVAVVTAVALPHWLEATRGEARVRLIVDQWGADASLP